MSLKELKNKRDWWNRAIINWEIFSISIIILYFIFSCIYDFYSFEHVAILAFGLNGAPTFFCIQQYAKYMRLYVDKLQEEDFDRRKHESLKNLGYGPLP